MRNTALILSLIITLATTSAAFAQDGDLPFNGARTNSYTCEITGAISLSGDSKKIDGQTLTGRGMATCKNDQGFSTDYPIVMKMTADTSLKDLMTNTGVRAVAEPFAVTRDPNEMFDSYENYNMLHPKVSAHLARGIQSAGTARSIANSRSIVLHGAKNKLFINLTLLGDPDALTNLKIHNLTLAFDNQAPNLD